MERILYESSVEECEKAMRNPNATGYIIIYDEEMEKDIIGKRFEKQRKFQNLKKISRSLGVFLISYKEVREYIIDSRLFKFGHR